MTPSEYQDTVLGDYRERCEGIHPDDRKEHPNFEPIVQWYQENEDDLIAHELKEGRVTNQMKKVLDHLTKLVRYSSCRMYLLPITIRAEFAPSRLVEPPRLRLRRLHGYTGWPACRLQLRRFPRV